MTTPPNERIQALDVLRGFALCGIVFINIYQTLGMRELPTGLALFVQARFYVIFSLLLGVGIMFVGGAGLIPGLFLIGSALASYRVPEELPGRAGLLAAQAVLSPLWLRRFRYGPVEWLWRCVTWWRWMPIRAPEVRATT